MSEDRHDLARLEQASLWRERVADDADGETREEFVQWIAASPANAAAYGDVQRAWELTRAAAEAPAIIALRQQALARLAPDARRSSRWPRAAAAAVVLVFAVPAMWLAYSHMAPMLSGNEAASVQHYRTALGERRTIRLTDGSEVTLNTDSALQVAYSFGERRLMLDRGQALFSVAKDAERPFSVTSGGRRVVAVGTEFEVRAESGFYRVALLEGAVSISATPNGQGAPVSLRPNQVFTVRGDTTSVVRDDVRALVSWRSGLLTLHDRDLRSAAAEMNRYDRRRIELADAQTGRMRISGAFRVGDNEAFAEALAEVLSLEVTDRTADRIVLKGR